ncbi:hypothetical protein D6C89_10615 [Aureobasidium pullulans]|nr:hypothetical protein D6C89_10615 [Aureobasidium pullulans]
MPRTRDLGDNSLTKAQIKYVKAKLRNIMRQKAALDLENTNWFTTETARLAPEQYINVEMIKAKIMNNEYRTLNDIRDDFELLVGNVVWGFGSLCMEAINARAVRDEFYKQMLGCPVAPGAGADEDEDDDEE